MAIPETDATVHTFEEAAEKLDEAAAETTAAAEGARQLRLQRLRGLSWREVFDSPESKQLLSSLGNASRSLLSAAGRLRRAVATALFTEGVRVGKIAEVLGVSHQRVSRLLAHRRADSSRSAPQ